MMPGFRPPMRSGDHAAELAQNTRQNNHAKRVARYLELNHARGKTN